MFFCVSGFEVHLHVTHVTHGPQKTKKLNLWNLRCYVRSCPLQASCTLEVNVGEKDCYWHLRRAASFWMPVVHDGLGHDLLFGPTRYSDRSCEHLRLQPGLAV